LLGEAYNGYTVIVNVCFVVEGFFNLCVFLVRPERQPSVIVSSIWTLVLVTASNSRNAGRVEVGLVDGIGHHVACEEWRYRGRMEIGTLLF
jgi:hypothetical protein